MKKFLATLLATGVLLFAGGANAGVISSTNAVGMPGETVTLDVSLVSGDITLGGDFTIGYDITKLTLVGVVGRLDAQYDFSLSFFLDPTLYLAYSGPTLLAIGPIDSIFSILFQIANPYPAVSFPDVTTVTINGYLWGDVGQTVEVPLDQAITPTITVAAPNKVPEPTALALVGLALLVMVGVGRRSRMRRG